MIDCRVNGEAVDLVSVTDRGLNYGDGLFETILFSAGQLHFWSDHYLRLVTGCKKLLIEVPEESWLLEQVAQLGAGNQTGDKHKVKSEGKPEEKMESAVIKIIISRGKGGRGYLAQDVAGPTVIVTLNEMPSSITTMRRDGLICGIAEHPLVINPALAGIKHLNRIDQVLARNEWHNGQVNEVLMQDVAGNFVEGCSSNLFAVVGNRLLTPPADVVAVNGVVRNRILQWCEQSGLEVQQGQITEQHVAEATEVFVCNSIWGVIAVNRIIAKNEQVIADYSQGKITDMLKHKFSQSQQCGESNATVV